MNFDVFTSELAWVILKTVSSIAFVLFLVSFVLILMNKRLQVRDKFLWLLGSLLLPILGPILFITIGRTGH
ncbi:PLDc N-terminal domain-containing protein [Pararhodonellum marinum]|uniref:PLDc N-terminal domain-containing protein n=1 Tax=Pararhodonellum marinum TaxID=2755358 RepID=UPI00188E939D|nr:PLDc N-terminal domain-containing protein [Pararhodonellum marinum]